MAKKRGPRKKSTVEVLEFIEKKYGNHIRNMIEQYMDMPELCLADLGSLMGCTREYARQIIKRIYGTTDKPKLVVGKCGYPKYYKYNKYDHDDSYVFTIIKKMASMGIQLDPNGFMAHNVFKCNNKLYAVRKISEFSYKKNGIKNAYLRVRKQNASVPKNEDGFYYIVGEYKDKLYCFPSNIWGQRGHSFYVKHNELNKYKAEKLLNG